MKRGSVTCRPDSDTLLYASEAVESAWDPIPCRHVGLPVREDDGFADAVRMGSAIRGDLADGAVSGVRNRAPGTCRVRGSSYSSNANPPYLLLAFWNLFLCVETEIG